MVAGISGVGSDKPVFASMHTQDLEISNASWCVHPVICNFQSSGLGAFFVSALMV